MHKHEAAISKIFIITKHFKDGKINIYIVKMVNLNEFSGCWQ